MDARLRGNASIESVPENATVSIEAALRADPRNPKLYVQRARIALKSGEIDRAMGDLANARDIAPDDPSIARRHLAALMNYGRKTGFDRQAIADVAEKTERFWERDALLALLAGRALIAAGRGAAGAYALRWAIQRKRRTLAWASAVLESAGPLSERPLAMGVVQAVVERMPNRPAVLIRAARLADRLDDPAAEDLLASIFDQDPDHSGAWRLRGERAFVREDYDTAITALKKSIALKPASAGPYEKLSKALWRMERFDEAADAMLAAIERRPEDASWHRRAAIALLSAGRDAEADLSFRAAKRLIDERLGTDCASDMIRARRDFDPTRLRDSVTRWAWSLAVQDRYPFDQWQRRAYRGMRANHILRDWTEARPHRIQEIERLIDPVDQDGLDELLKKGRGLLLVGAHLGPYFATPIMLASLGRPWMWLASAPPLGNSAVAQNLISTATHRDPQISEALQAGLKAGKIVYVLMDGRQYRGRRKVNLNGADISFPKIGARLARSLDTPTLYVRAAWRKGQLSFTFHQMPLPQPDETLEQFDERWTERYFQHVRKHLAGAPENLTLSGGLWDAVARIDRPTT